MKHITQAIAADILNQLGDVFDTHDIDRRILRIYPIEVAEELLEFRATDDPLLRFSAAFSQWIGRTFSGQIAKAGLGKVRTANLGGELSDNQRWTRLNPAVPIH